MLIANGADVNAQSDMGTPLHLAAGFGHNEIAKLLIAKGADVNARGFLGTPTLHMAASEGHKEIVELLIGGGADVNAKYENVLTPLDLATGNKETADLLRKHGGKTGEELKAAQPEPPTAKEPNISIHEAARDGNIEAVKQHLADGTDVHETDDIGQTPLHIAATHGYNAATHGYKEIAELLIAEGADVNAKDENGWTPLLVAAYWGGKEIAELLIVEGADVNAKGGIGGGTPLHRAAQEGYMEIVELLIAKGADVNATDMYRRTPLDLAIQQKQTADLLRKHGGKTKKELKAAGN